MRIHLKGFENPNPTVALPDIGADFDIPSQAFFLEDGVPFLKADYIATGYTHYEVWCVGAVGGRGGGVLGSYGGAGGGGGVHRVAGLLSGLPDICPVVVGEAGAEGAPGTGQYQKFPVFDSSDNLIGYDDNPLWWPGQPGEDGGASSFNGATAQASGGKGGSPSQAERPYLYPTISNTIARLLESVKAKGPGGDGGEGGIGGSLVAGGGSDGGRSEVYYDGPENDHPAGHIYFEAENGFWDTAIGSGGGGGWGGNSINPEPLTDTPGIIRQAGSGANGAYSFSDTSVYGPGQNRSGNRLTIPGTGGGARINKLYGYGSRAPAYSPNGAVFIRLMKLS